MYKNTNGLAGLFSSGKVLFWVTVFTFIFAFWYLFSDLCFSFMIGFILAYICVPAVNWLSEYTSRGLVSCLFTIGVVSFFVVGMINIFPIAVDYFSKISENIPAYYQKSLELISQLCDSLGIPQFKDNIQELRGDMLKYIGQKVYVFSSLIKGIASQCTAFTGFMSSIFIATISFFYFLKDWNDIKSKCYGYIPLRQKNIFREVGKLVRNTLSDFFSGQFSIVTILSIYYGVALWMIGIKHFVMLGVMSGLFSFIPFIGALFSLFIAVFISATSLSLIDLYCIVAVYLIGQLIEGYVLSPKFIGDKTGLHPLCILFSFFAGYQLKGVMGVIVAIPLTAVINNLIIFAMGRFKQSQTYKQ